MEYIHANCSFCDKPVVRWKQAKDVKRHFCTMKCKSEFQKLAKPVSREWLVEHYIDKGLNTTEIAIMVGRDPKSVWNWLKDFGIPRRPRGFGLPIEETMRRLDKARKTWGGKHTEETKKRLSDMAKADGRMPFKAENGPPMRGKKGSETTNWKGGITPERQAFYSSDAWKKAERAVKKRDNRTCQMCGKVKGKGSRDPFDIHHIVGFACVELRADVDNLVYLCEPCHYWVHGKGNVNKEFIKENPNGGY